MDAMTWLQPKTVVQIRFVEWIAEGNLLHAALLEHAPPKQRRPLLGSQFDIECLLIGQTYDCPGENSCGIEMSKLPDSPRG